MTLMACVAANVGSPQRFRLAEVAYDYFLDRREEGLLVPCTDWMLSSPDLSSVR